MFEIQINISSSLGTADRPETVMRAVSRKKHGDVALSTEWSWPAAQLVHRAFQSRRGRHQSHLWDTCKQFLKRGTRHLGTVRHPEGATGKTFPFVHCLAALDNEGLTEAIEKPLGILNAKYLDLAGVCQRMCPYTEWVHCLAPSGDVDFWLRSFTDGNGFP